MNTFNENTVAFTFISAVDIVATSASCNHVVTILHIPAPQ